MVRPGHVLIANVRSVISAGTEKMVMDLAKKSLLGKAKERPDQVRRVIEKMRNEGLINTIAQVREKLDEPMTMGYSSAGVVLASGAGVQGFKPGDRVASNGAHAEVVSVAKHLCALVPEQVSLEHAAFVVLGAIALQGVRLARVGLGETVFVIGLGLIGQITVALLKANGCRVIGTDLDQAKSDLALKMGADVARMKMGSRDLVGLTGGVGADAVLITASSKSNDPVELAGETVRQKGRVVAVGAVGLNLPRRPYYFKEAEIVVSCSYGPGRYDPQYEERGRDYPAAYVRWTEQRNMQAVLDLMASGRLDVSPLITHRFKIEQAEAAYDLIEKDRESYLGILLEYPEVLVPTRKLELKPSVSGKVPERGEFQSTIRNPQSAIGVGVLGAGNFARMVLLPTISKNKMLNPRILCSAGGLSAAHSGEKFGFEIVTSDEEEVFNDPNVGVVFVLTRHDQHAHQVIKALQAGKHVFVEKPLCMNLEELQNITDTYNSVLSTQHSALVLMVGFNRRFSPAIKSLKDFFAGVDVPLTVSIRFNAGEIPSDHWTQDDDVGGGRIIGEACHSIDLAIRLTGSVPVRVYAESIGGTGAPKITDDQCFITLRHANGSISNIGYLAGGDKAFPKERVEVIGGGQVAVIEDFREVITCARGKIKKTHLGGQDKGHRGEVEAIVEALTKGGKEPIPWEELRAVTMASILAVRSMREGIPFDIPVFASLSEDDDAPKILQNYPNG
jgi:predicted dehydrogenase/threonine dehydrogenase-like Zn-dependent dehydrogenase